jgi:hypothetical protein
VDFATVASHKGFWTYFLKASLHKKPNIIEKITKTLALLFFYLLSQSSRETRYLYETFVDSCKKPYAVIAKSPVM